VATGEAHVASTHIMIYVTDLHQEQCINILSSCVIIGINNYRRNTLMYSDYTIDSGLGIYLNVYLNVIQIYHLFYIYMVDLAFF